MVKCFVNVEPLALVLGSLAIVLGTFLQRVSRMGVGLIVSPALGFLLGPHIGIFATNVVTVVSAFILMFIRWRDVDWPRVAWMVICAIPGSITGALLVRALPTAWLQIILGGTVLFAITLSFARAARSRPDSAGKRILAGISGGLLNTTVGVAGPAMVIYSRNTGWPYRSFAGSLQPIFVFLGTFSIATKTYFGSIDVAGGLPAWWYIFVVALAVGVGAVIGTFATRHLPPERAQKLTIILASLGALAVLIRGLLALV